MLLAPTHLLRSDLNVQRRYGLVLFLGVLPLLPLLLSVPNGANTGAGAATAWRARCQRGQGRREMRRSSKECSEGRPCENELRCGRRETGFLHLRARQPGRGRGTAQAQERRCEAAATGRHTLIGGDHEEDKRQRGPRCTIEMRNPQKIRLHCTAPGFVYLPFHYQADGRTAGSVGSGGEGEA